MIEWLNEYQGYFIYPSLIIGMMWCLLTMPEKSKLPRNYFEEGK